MYIYYIYIVLKEEEEYGMESLNDIVSSINGVLWSSVIIVLLVGAGVYFTIRTKAV